MQQRISDTMHLAQWLNPANDPQKVKSVYNNPDFDDLLNN